MTKNSKDKKYKLTFGEAVTLLNSIAAGEHYPDDAPFSYKITDFLMQIWSDLYDENDKYEKEEGEGFDISKLTDKLLEFSSLPVRGFALALLGLCYAFYGLKLSQYNKFAVQGAMNTETPYTFWGIDLGLMQ